MRGSLRSIKIEPVNITFPDLRIALLSSNWVPLILAAINLLVRAQDHILEGANKQSPLRRSFVEDTDGGLRDCIDLTEIYFKILIWEGFSKTISNPYCG